MGDILRARCECGYLSEALYLGGGMTNFTTYSGTPAYCDVCNSMLVLNYFDEDPCCKRCGSKVTFYNSSDLQGSAKKGDKLCSFSWYIFRKNEHFTLPAMRYLCPECRQKEMIFESIGCWD